MKKLILSLLVMAAGCTLAFAATPAEESAQRIEKLTKLLEKIPDATGVADLDAYVQSSAKGATAAVQNSVSLNSITQGEQLAEAAITLANGLKEEKDALEESTKLAPKAVEGLKKLNPMKAGKAKKALDFANQATTLVTEESVYQAEVISKLGK